MWILFLDFQDIFEIAHYADSEIQKCMKVVILLVCNVSNKGYSIHGIKNSHWHGLNYQEKNEFIFPEFEYSLSHTYN